MVTPKGFKEIIWTETGIPVDFRTSEYQDFGNRYAQGFRTSERQNFRAEM